MVSRPEIFNHQVAAFNVAGLVQISPEAGQPGGIIGLRRPLFKYLITGGQDTIDFADIDPTEVQQPTYSSTASGGTLTVTNGAWLSSLAGAKISGSRHDSPRWQM